MQLRQLTSKRYAKGILAVLGAIIVGAIGSGVWETLLKPALTSSRDTILNLISFGVESYKDATYIEIARGLHEGASLELLLSFTFLFVMLAILYIADTLEKLFDAKRRQDEMIKDVNDLMDRTNNLGKASKEGENPEDLKKSILELKQSVERQSLRALKISAYGLVVSTIAVASFAVVGAIKANYVNSAVANFQQVYTIASPFMDDKKRAATLSLFAQIKHKSDYVSLVTDLKAIARSNGQFVPEFDAW